MGTSTDSVPSCTLSERVVRCRSVSGSNAVEFAETEPGLQSALGRPKLAVLTDSRGMWAAELEPHEARSHALNERRGPSEYADPAPGLFLMVAAADVPVEVSPDLVEGSGLADWPQRPR